MTPTELKSLIIHTNQSSGIMKTTDQFDESDHYQEPQRLTFSASVPSHRTVPQVIIVVVFAVIKVIPFIVVVVEIVVLLIVVDFLHLLIVVLSLLLGFFLG